MTNIAFSIYNTSMNSYTIDKIYPHLENQYGIYLFHIDSLTKDRQLRNTNKHKYKSFDLGMKKVNNIIDLIKSLNITVIIFFTFSSDYDKLLNNICKYLNIKTVLHDHGMSYGKTITSFFNLNFNSIIRKYHFKKNIYFLKFKMKSKFENEISFDFYLFYSKNNYAYFNNFFKLDCSNTTLCSIPLFDTDIDKEYYKKIKKDKTFLYIHQPFVKNKQSKIKIKEEIKFFNEIGKILNLRNYKLEIRLHPSSDFNKYNRYKLTNNAYYKNDIDLINQVSSCTAIIGHWSTAISTAFPLNIPVIITEFPFVKKKYYKYYDIYKKTCLYLPNIKDIITLIDNNTLNYSYNINEVEYLIGKENTSEFNSKKLVSIIKLIS